jgi:hypothetical protein
VPGGTVAFYNGSTRLGTVALSETGEAQLTTGLAIGTSSLSAQYSGDASFVASTGTLSHVVSSSSQSTTTTLTVSPSQASLGQTVTMTATVSRPAGQASGTVRFFDGDTAIGESALVNGVAKLTTNAFASGAHALSAAYLGTSSAPPSLSKVVALSVGGGTRTPTLSLTASPSTGVLDAESAFTLKVTGQLFRVPSGQVQFLFDGLPANAAHRVAVQSNTSTSVVATVRLNTLPRGTHRVTAVYLGDGNFRSGAAVLTFVVQ